MSNDKRTVSAFVHDQLVRRTKKSYTTSTFCTGGPGGQKQNNSQQGYAITDKETGIRCEGREFRSQAQNKSAAFTRLIDKLIEHYEAIEKKDKLERFKTDLAECRVYRENLRIAKDSESGFTQDLYRTLDGDLEGFHKARLLKEL